MCHEMVLTGIHIYRPNTYPFAIKTLYSDLRWGETFFIHYKTFYFTLKWEETLKKRPIQNMDTKIRKLG